MTEAMMRAALYALAEHGTVTDAARALGLSRSTLDSRIVKARTLLTQTSSQFEVETLPDELPTADELIKRRITQFSRKSTAEDARKLIPVKVKVDGPFGLALFGDPHVDDDGCDMALLCEHVKIVERTDALFAGNVGDYSNNWIGRLARLYGQQSLSAAEAWVLVEWLVRALPWLFLVGGNHDAWSGDGDPIKWMAKHARVTYESNGMRLGLTTPSGRVIRLNARHDFTGKSQWNTAHGPSKAAQMGWRDHLLVCGHTHVSGYQFVKDPDTGLISHALRISSYKTIDRYAKEKGLPNQAVSPCPVVIVQPDQPDDSAKLLTVFQDTATGADFLTWLRKRKSTRAA